MSRAYLGTIHSIVSRLKVYETAIIRPEYRNAFLNAAAVQGTTLSMKPFFKPKEGWRFQIKRMPTVVAVCNDPNSRPTGPHGIRSQQRS